MEVHMLFVDQEIQPPTYIPSFCTSPFGDTAVLSV